MNSLALRAYNLSLEESSLLKSLVILAAEKTRARWRWTDDIGSSDLVVTAATTGRLVAHEDTLSAMGSPPP